MPEFTVKAEIQMYTEITPDGYFRGIDGLEDESSYYAGDGLTFDAEVTFTIEADDEDDANVRAHDLLSDRLAFYDNNGIEWSFEEITITDVERITPPMNIDLALSVLRDYLRLVSTGQVITPAQPNIEALQFLVEWTTQLRAAELHAGSITHHVPGPPGIVATS